MPVCIVYVCMRACIHVCLSMYVSMDGIDIFHYDPFVKSPLTREIGLFTGEIEIFVLSMGSFYPINRAFYPTGQIGLFTRETGLFIGKIGLFTLLIELFDPINRGFCL